MLHGWPNSEKHIVVVQAQKPQILFRYQVNLVQIVTLGQHAADGTGRPLVKPEFIPHVDRFVEHEPDHFSWVHQRGQTGVGLVVAHQACGARPKPFPQPQRACCGVVQAAKHLVEILFQLRPVGSEGQGRKVLLGKLQPLANLVNFTTEVAPHEPKVLCRPGILAWRLHKWEKKQLALAICADATECPCP